MTTRTTRSSVTFHKPFALSSVEGVQPAGTYEILVDEELLQELSFVAYRRVATMIILPARTGRSGTTETVTVDPSELDAARRRDAEPDHHD